MNYLIIDKQFLILCKFIIIGSDILFNRLCLFRRVCRLFGGFSARFTDLGANKCMPDRQFIRLHLNLCRQNTFHSANIFLYFLFHQGDVTLRFSCSDALGFESPCPHQKCPPLRAAPFLCALLRCKSGRLRADNRTCKGNPTKVSLAHIPFLAICGGADNKSCGQSHSPPKAHGFWRLSFAAIDKYGCPMV